MRSCVVCFTYPRDYLKACRLLKNWQGKVDTIFFCIEPRHQNFPLPEWATPLVANFNRGPSLRGSQAVIGMKGVYEALVEQGYDLIIKIDSDTIIFNHDMFIEPIKLGTDFVFIKRLYANQLDVEHNSTNKDRLNVFTRFCNGCAYSLSKSAIESLNNIPVATFDAAIFQFKGNEDLFFSYFLTTNPILGVFDVDKTKFFFSELPYRKSDVIGAHFGYSSDKRIKEELLSFKPLEYDTAFSKDVEEYIKKLRDYCDSINYILHEHYDVFDRNGHEIKPLKRFYDNNHPKTSDTGSTESSSEKSACNPGDDSQLDPISAGNNITEHAAKTSSRQTNKGRFTLA